jgi:hypothetical protein
VIFAPFCGDSTVSAFAAAASRRHGLFRGFNFQIEVERIEVSPKHARILQHPSRRLASH